jgi:hypothetical protein
MPLEQELLWAGISGKSYWTEALRLLRDVGAQEVTLTLATDFGVEGMTPESLFELLQAKLEEEFPVRTAESELSAAGDLGVLTFELESGARVTVEWYARTEGATGESEFDDVQQA